MKLLALKFCASYGLFMCLLEDCRIDVLQGVKKFLCSQPLVGCEHRRDDQPWITRLES